jgi:LPS export ABC transporter protein LptC
MNNTVIARRALGLVIAVALSLNSCTSGETEPPRTNIAADENQATQTGSNTRVAFSSDGIVRAILNAKGIRMFERQHYTLLDSAVRVDFFDQQNRHSSILTSHRAFINDLNKNMTAYDSVRIVSDSGTTVNTDSLFWDNNTKLIHSDANVVITEKNGRITKGKGFESDQDMTDYHILHPVIDAPASVFQNPNAQQPLATPFKP